MRLVLECAEQSDVNSQVVALIILRSPTILRRLKPGPFLCCSSGAPLGVTGLLLVLRAYIIAGGTAELPALRIHCVLAATLLTSRAAGRFPKAGERAAFVISAMKRGGRKGYYLWLCAQCEGRGITVDGDK